jgi:hypothetical protein
MNEKMNITSAKYIVDLLTNKNVGIAIVLDGENLSIPLNEANRHYIEIKRQVDEGELTIEDAD